MTPLLASLLLGEEPLTSFSLCPEVGWRVLPRHPTQAPSCPAFSGGPANLPPTFGNLELKSGDTCCPDPRTPGQAVPRASLRAPLGRLHQGGPASPASAREPLSVPAVSWSPFLGRHPLCKQLRKRGFLLLFLLLFYLLFLHLRISSWGKKQFSKASVKCHGWFIFLTLSKRVRKAF